MDPVTEITEEQTPRGAWTVTTLLFLYLLVNFADKAVVGLAAVPIMRELDLSPKQFGLVGSSFSFLFSLSAILVGFVANRVAVRWVLLALAFSWAVVQFPMVGAAGLATLVVCRVLLGAGEGPAFSMAVHALYEWFPDQQRTLPTAVLTQGAAFGVIVALPALNWIIVHYSWHWAFFALGVVGLLWVVAWLLLWPKRSHCRTGASGCGRVSRVSTQTRALPAAAAESDLHRLLPSVLRSNVGTRPRAHVVHSFHHNWPRLLAGECGLGLGTAMDNGRGGRSDDGLCIADLDGAGASPRVARGVLGSAPLVAGGLIILIMPHVVDPAWQVALIVVGGGLTGSIFVVCPPIISAFTPVAQRAAVIAIFVAIHTSAAIFAPIVTGNVIETAATSLEGYYAGYTITALVQLFGGFAGLLLLRPASQKAGA